MGEILALNNILGEGCHDAEPLDWIAKALKDMPPSKYFYEHGDVFDADEKKLIVQGVAAFGGIAPTSRIALLAKPTFGTFILCADQSAENVQFHDSRG